MASPLSRREFLRLLAPLPLALPLLSRLGEAISQAGAAAQQPAAKRPNVLIVVYDTLAAAHLPLYGYPRPTTPNLERFAARASVYHHHVAGGNFTTTGAASLLTGVYPWTHRAYNIAAPVDRAFLERNLFSAFRDQGYYRLAYTHNWLANFFLQQFQADIDLFVEPEQFFLLGTPPLYKLFPGDEQIAYRGYNFQTRVIPTEREKPGSLFLSLLNEAALEQYGAGMDPDLAAIFPDGLPTEEHSKSFFLLEHAIDGIMALLSAAPAPFLGYFHLYPPHYPYNPRREFIGRFDDGWAPEGKPAHFLSDGQTDSSLNRRRRRYDEYLAYADAEFGRLYDFLDRSGRLEDTLVIFTSDHGEMFERGIKGHNTPVLYSPLVRIPLLVHHPGQARRLDFHTPTSCTDILPTLLQAAGRPLPGWIEGLPLPQDPTEAPIERTIFSLDSRQNPRDRPLEKGTLAMVKGPHKLLHYRGYPGHERGYELYDLEEDPQELHDLYSRRSALASGLIDEFEARLNQVNEPFDD